MPLDARRHRGIVTFTHRGVENVQREKEGSERSALKYKHQDLEGILAIFVVFLMPFSFAITWSRWPVRTYSCFI